MLRNEIRANVEFPTRPGEKQLPRGDCQKWSTAFSLRRGTAVNPSEYAIGSLESRAAARAVAESRETDSFRLQIVNHIERPRQDNSRPHVGKWRAVGDGLMRIVYVPENTDEATIEKLLATP